MEEISNNSQTKPYGEEEASGFNFAMVMKILILNWYWFVLSLIVCVGLSVCYLRYKSPTYEVTTKMLIKDEQNQRNRAQGLMQNMQDFGFLSNSAGIDNEIEILASHSLAHEAVMNLKLHTSYYMDGKVKNQLVYKHQPISVDIDPATLKEMNNDEDPTSVASLKLTINKRSKEYHVRGTLYTKTKGLEYEFNKKVSKLPATFNVNKTVITLSETQTLRAKRAFQKMDRDEIVYVRPSQDIARTYVKRLTVAPTSKVTSIAQISVQDQNVDRARDYLNELIACYNAEANNDKNEIAVKTEEFINQRLDKINAELGTTEDQLENYKRANSVIDATGMADLTQSTQYYQKLSEARNEVALIKYLREFVEQPGNVYQIIPSNVGLKDQVSYTLINEHNKLVLDRNRLLRTSSELSPQVQQVTSQLDDLHGSILAALEQASRTADINARSLQAEYNKFQARVSSSPEHERILSQIGRQQEVKAGLYLLLLQKREENSISLAATADRGKVIDTITVVGKVSPKSSIILLIGLILGLALPFAFFFFLKDKLRYKIEGHDDLAELTKLPIIADVAVANNADGVGGIVVKANRNSSIDEIFRSFRTNIQFMLKENEKVIMFTSNMSGEGKTFNAANLAASFALLDKKVVIIGLDIRKPALGKLFQLKDTKRGITQVLGMDNPTWDDLNDILNPSVVVGNLDLILAGPIPPNPAELLARPSLGKVIDILKERYDYVILDTAPVGLVSDTLHIAPYANVTVIVSRADYTPRAFVAYTNELAEENKLPNVCMILNGVDMSKKKYGYAYGYGRYGRYGRYYGYGRYGHYGKYGKYGSYGHYGHYGSTYSKSHYGDKDDKTIKV